MTCVACSGAIERGMKNEFKDKGLIYEESKKEFAVNVILLMHKMKIVFWKEKAKDCKITARKIADEVEDLGFGAELINQNEIKPFGRDKDLEFGKTMVLKKCELKIKDFDTA